MKLVHVEREPKGKRDRVEVRFSYSEEDVESIKLVPSARFVPPNKGGPFWRVNMNLEYLRELREEFGERLRIGPDLKDWAAEAAEEERNLKNLSNADDAELYNVPESLIKNFKGPGKGLRPYQRADIAFMANANVVNTNQPGSGKTIETIGAIFEAELEWGFNLIVAPVTSLHSVWEQDILEAYKAAGYEEPLILTGQTARSRALAVQEAYEASQLGEAFWLVINPYMIRTQILKDKKKRPILDKDGKAQEVLIYPELEKIDWDAMYIDEFHLMGLSNHKTAGAKGAHRIRRATDPTRCGCLSGTPMGGKPIKLFGALQFVAPEIFTSKWQWAKRWLVIEEGQYGNSIHGVQKHLEDEFYDHLKPYLVRRTKREVLPGLPPKQRIDIWCDMTPKQEQQYKRFATEAEWRIDDMEEAGRVSATNILSEYTRLKQFAGAYCDVTGSIETDSLRVIPTTNSGKMDQLIEKLNEENVLSDDEPKTAIIFSQFTGMVNMIYEKMLHFGIDTKVITGATKEKDRASIVESFQKGEGPRVIVINTKAGGTAITLSKADSVHIMDETWVPDDQEQAEDRAHRGDDFTMAKDEVRIYYYRTRQTIEEHIRQLVSDKQDVNTTILDLRRLLKLQEVSGVE